MDTSELLNETTEAPAKKKKANPFKAITSALRGPRKTPVADPAKREERKEKALARLEAGKQSAGKVVYDVCVALKAGATSTEIRARAGAKIDRFDYKPVAATVREIVLGMERGAPELSDVYEALGI